MRRSNKKHDIQDEGLKVTVRDGQFEKALRQFKRKVDQSGILRELKEREHYVKPTTKRKLAKAAARKRWLKQQRILEERG